MTLPLWSIIILTLLATWGIYATLKLVKRNITIDLAYALENGLTKQEQGVLIDTVQDLIKQRDALEEELDEWERAYKDIERMKKMEGNDEKIR